MIDITFDHTQGNSAAVDVNGVRAYIDVTDDRGINGLTAVTDSDGWPDEIIVLLRLQGLEHLEISYGNVTITTGRSSNGSPDPPLILSVIDETGETQSASPSYDIYYPHIEHTAEGFEITLPPHFFIEERPSFSLQWIDFYR